MTNCVNMIQIANKFKNFDTIFFCEIIYNP